MRGMVGGGVAVNGFWGMTPSRGMVKVGLILFPFHCFGVNFSVFDVPPLSFVIVCFGLFCASLISFPSHCTALFDGLSPPTVFIQAELEKRQSRKSQQLR